MLAEERGWSKTALSGAAALQQMEAAILGPVLGWLLDRFGPRVFIRAGVMVGWAIGDRFDKRLISAVCMLMHAVGLLLLTYAVAMPMLVGFTLLAVLAGLGSSFFLLARKPARPRR